MKKRQLARAYIVFGTIALLGGCAGTLPPGLVSALVSASPSARPGLDALKLGMSSRDAFELLGAATIQRTATSPDGVLYGVDAWVQDDGTYINASYAENKVIRISRDPRPGDPHDLFGAVTSIKPSSSPEASVAQSRTPSPAPTPASTPTPSPTPSPSATTGIPEPKVWGQIKGTVYINDPYPASPEGVEVLIESWPGDYPIRQRIIVHGDAFDFEHVPVEQDLRITISNDQGESKSQTVRIHQPYGSSEASTSVYFFPGGATLDHGMRGSSASVDPGATAIASPVTTPASGTSGPSALCNDGTVSYSATRSGTCSHHGGVAVWY